MTVVAQTINEAFLEMHYHAAFLSAFEEHFGHRAIRLWKPSQPDEAFVGFDQSWIRYPAPIQPFRLELIKALRAGDETVDGLYLVASYNSSAWKSSGGCRRVLRT